MRNIYEIYFSTRIFVSEIICLPFLSSAGELNMFLKVTSRLYNPYNFE